LIDATSIGGTVLRDENQTVTWTESPIPSVFQVHGDFSSTGSQAQGRRREGCSRKAEIFERNLIDALALDADLVTVTGISRYGIREQKKTADENDGDK